MHYSFGYRAFCDAKWCMCWSSETNVICMVRNPYTLYIILLYLQALTRYHSLDTHILFAFQVSNHLLGKAETCVCKAGSYDFMLIKSTMSISALVMKITDFQKLREIEASITFCTKPLCTGTKNDGVSFSDLPVRKDYVCCPSDYKRDLKEGAGIFARSSQLQKAWQKCSHQRMNT